MKKVLLVNTNTEQAPYPVPPVGICMLASRLENTYETKVYDGVFSGCEGLVETVLQFKPDYIGFSIRNIDDVVADRRFYYVDAVIKNFIEPVRKATSVPVILGGSGFSIFPEELMSLSKADFGIAGDGIEPLPRLLAVLDKGDDPSGIPNVYSAQLQAGLKKDKTPAEMATWNGFSRIDRWIDFAPYRKRGAYSIQTKRGCSHGCVYCTYPLIEGKKFITRDAAEIVDEISETCDRLGDVTFEFVDSTFNDPEYHAEKICREIIRRNLKVRLRTMGINPRHTSENLFELMMKAGFTQIDATPDTASEVMLKNMGKGFTLEEIQKMALLIRKFELPTMWFFLFGGPGEDEQTFRETIDFIDHYVSSEDLVYMSSGLRIYPNTPLYDIALREKRFSATESLLNPPQFYFSEKLTRDQLNALINNAERHRHNCIPALQTSPPPAMMAEAMALRSAENLTEPMFRTLLRIRKDWMLKGLL